MRRAVRPHRRFPPHPRQHRQRSDPCSLPDHPSTSTASTAKALRRRGIHHAGSIAGIPSPIPHLSITLCSTYTACIPASHFTVPLPRQHPDVHPVSGTPKHHRPSDPNSELNLDSLPTIHILTSSLLFSHRHVLTAYQKRRRLLDASSILFTSPLVSPQDVQPGDFTLEPTSQTSLTRPICPRLPISHTLISHLPRTRSTHPSKHLSVYPSRHQNLSPSNHVNT